MVEVIVERSFEDPADYDAIQARENCQAGCFDEHRVRFLGTWLSKDRRRMICLYEAPDAESVRIVQRQAKMPLDRVWSATRTSPPAGSLRPAPEAQEHVVVERSFETPITPAAIAALLEKGGECLPRHRVAYLGGHLASDGRRMICVFLAPDAESVRIANRQGGAPFDRAWTAERRDPAPPA